MQWKRENSNSHSLNLDAEQRPRGQHGLLGGITPHRRTHGDSDPNLPSQHTS